MGCRLARGVYNLLKGLEIHWYNWGEGGGGVVQLLGRC